MGHHNRGCPGVRLARGGLSRPTLVRVVAIPDEDWLDRQWDRVNLTERIPPQLHWEKHLLQFTPHPVHAEIDNVSVVASYVDQVLTRSGAWEYDRQQVTEGLLANMRVPVFGSPPKDWAKLGSLSVLVEV